MKTAGWSSAATFARFYDNEIDTGSSFAASVANKVASLCHNSCAISCFEISRDFGVRTMTRENQTLNETYLRSKFDWDSAESSDCNNSIPLNLTTVAKC